jgi:GNAT superfamily N-acetyltransferase
MLALAPVVPEDFEAMLLLRIDALRESLERLGRFNPAVARERLAGQFWPEHMRHICRAGERIGFFTVTQEPAALRLHHFYLHPGAQGQGAGSWVMAQIKARAQAAGLPITLAALKLSEANAFYRRQGFEVVEAQDFDIEYRWTPAGAAA